MFLTRIYLFWILVTVTLRNNAIDAVKCGNFECHENAICKFGDKTLTGECKEGYTKDESGVNIYCCSKVGEKCAIDRVCSEKLKCITTGEKSVNEENVLDTKSGTNSNSTDISSNNPDKTTMTTVDSNTDETTVTETDFTTESTVTESTVTESTVTDSTLSDETTETDFTISSESTVTDTTLSSESTVTDTTLSYEFTVTDTTLSDESTVTDSTLSDESTVTHSTLSHESTVTDSTLSEESIVTEEHEFSTISTKESTVTEDNAITETNVGTEENKCGDFAKCNGKCCAINEKCSDRENKCTPIVAKTDAGTIFDLFDFNDIINDPESTTRTSEEKIICPTGHKLCHKKCCNSQEICSESSECITVVETQNAMAKKNKATIAYTSIGLGCLVAALAFGLFKLYNFKRLQRNLY